MHTCSTRAVPVQRGWCEGWSRVTSASLLSAAVHDESDFLPARGGPRVICVQCVRLWQQGHRMESEYAQLRPPRLLPPRWRTAESLLSCLATTWRRMPATPPPSRGRSLWWRAGASQPSGLLSRAQNRPEDCRALEHNAHAISIQEGCPCACACSGVLISYVCVLCVVCVRACVCVCVYLVVHEER